ncbi:hypothetical protein [Lentzea sp. NPDC051838]|uniref:hypothetical protein n=1 Tax=Lentzea sp. NPDC051838 TaxID=3154849 RepID=UPI003418D2A8
MRDLIEKYAWADEDDDLVLTLGVFPRGSIARATRIYGADDGEVDIMTHYDAWVPQEDFGSYFRVQIAEALNAAYGAVVAIEPNGWTGAVPEIARRASEGGRFFSVNWSMSGTRRIVEAVSGKVTAFFNPFLIGEPGGMGDVVPDWVEDVVFDIDQPNASSFAAVELRTGVQVEQAWFTEPLPTYRIPDPDVLLAGVEGARVP